MNNNILYHIKRINRQNKQYDLNLITANHRHFMDTQLIYNYLADLKTGYCNTIEEYKQKITASEIGFRAAYTQYLAETDGKGVNLILSDFQEFQETIDAMVREETNHRYYEQFVYASEKTDEAIVYMRRAREQYATGAESTRPQRAPKVNDTDERVISGIQGLARFLGCCKSMAWSIVNDGILKDAGIQYKVGNCWKFNAEGLKDFMRIHPNPFAHIRCIR